MKKFGIAFLIVLISLSGLLAQGHPDDLLQQARDAIRVFDLPAADQAYKDAMNRTGDDEEYDALRAEWETLEKINILLADGRRSLDRQDYPEALRKYSDAIAAMDASKSDIWNKAKAEALYSQGMVYYRQEKPIKAAEKFRSATEIDGSEEKYGKALIMVRNKHYSEGHKFYKRKDYESARIEYEKAVAVDPSFASGFYQLAIIAKKDGDMKKAESYYNKAVQADATHYKSWYGLGLLYSDAGNNAKAIQALKECVSINSEYAKAYYVLGKVYESQKNLNLAISNLKKAIQADNKYTRAYELLGKIYNDQEKYTATIALLKNLKGTATSYKTYCGLARAYNSTENFSLALTAANKSIAKKKNWSAAHIEKGDALRGLGRNKEAVEAYRKAASDARWKSVAEYRINELTKWQGK